MAWTNPKTWTGVIVTVADLNTHVRDNENYLHDAPGGSWYHSVGTQSVANVTWTPLTWDSTLSVNAGVALSGIDLTLTDEGLYLITSSAFFNASAVGGTRFMRLVDNTAGVVRSVGQGVALAGSNAAISVSHVVYTAGGNVYRVEVYQDSGGSLDVVNYGQTPALGCARVG